MFWRDPLKDPRERERLRRQAQALHESSQSSASWVAGLSIIGYFVLVCVAAFLWPVYGIAFLVAAIVGIILIGNHFYK